MVLLLLKSIQFKIKFKEEEDEREEEQEEGDEDDDGNENLFTSRIFRDGCHGCQQRSRGALYYLFHQTGGLLNGHVF